MARSDSLTQPRTSLFDATAGIATAGFTVALGAVVFFVGCTGTIDKGGGPSPDDDRVVGSSAGGLTNVISDGWEIAPVRHGNSVKMLNFRQMQSEVLRATTVAYRDWSLLRTTFGAPDFVSNYDEDRMPTATKIVTWRRVAYSVCNEMVAKESTTRNIFSSIAPTAAISATDPAVARQVEVIFTRFFLEHPSQETVTQSTNTLTSIVTAGGSPAEAWGSLCMAYLSSTRFLTY